MMLIGLAIVIGVCLGLTVLMDHDYGIGFIFLSAAFFWLAFVDILALTDSGYNIVVFRLAFFKFMCLIGSSWIFYEHLRRWLKEKRKDDGKKK